MPDFVSGTSMKEVMLNIKHDMTMLGDDMQLSHASYCTPHRLRIDLELSEIPTRLERDI